MLQNQAQPVGSIQDFNTQQIIFVSGKGGVGKSLVAAGIAAEQARLGRRVLLVEIGDKSYYADFFSSPMIGHEPIRTDFGFDLAMWSGDSCLKEYVMYYLKLERLYHIFFENKVMRALVNVAPGLNEIAILGKITSGVRKVGPELKYDLVVVDCYATGHALSLFQAPRGMMEAIGFGPMGAQSREMDVVIRNPKVSGYVVVTLLEDMPVTESLEFCDQLRSSLGVEAVVFANKILNIPVSEGDLRQLESDDPQGIGGFAGYLRLVSERQKRLLGILKKAFSYVHELPLAFSNEPSYLVNAISEAIREA